MAYIVRAAALVTPGSDELAEKPWVLIDGANIKEIGLGDPGTGSVPVMDFGDAYLMPGLIDAHVHLVLPGDGTPGEASALESDHALFARAAGNALRALTAGVTTLRDCGGRGTITVELRNAIATGLISGPRLVVAGPPLTYTGGHTNYFGGEVDSADEVRKRARMLLKQGVDFIKMMGTGGGTPGTVSSRAYFRTDEIHAAVEETHRVDRRVAVHVLCAEAARRALDAGVDNLEHGWFLSEDGSAGVDHDVVRRVAEAGVPVSSTLSVFRHALRAAPDSPAHELKRWRQNVEASLMTAEAYLGVGASLIMGTDAGWRHTPFDQPSVELQCLVDAGMKPTDALYHATTLTASAMGLESRIGRIESGFAADLLLLDENPVETVGAVDSVRAVVAAGRLLRHPGALNAFVVCR